MIWEWIDLEEKHMFHHPCKHKHNLIYPHHKVLYSFCADKMKWDSLIINIYIIGIKKKKREKNRSYDISDLPTDYTWYVKFLMYLNDMYMGEI